MAEEKRTDIGSLGEFGLIKHITKQFESKSDDTFIGIGDDAAILDFKDLLTVISTDMMVEGIHFDLAYSPLKHLGYKAVVTNLSDICAMNAIPTHITVSMALSNRFSVESVEELYKGIKTACDAYNVELIGGDTTSSNKGLILSITALGKVSKDDYVTRSGAKDGDIICISGDLGASFLGLQILEREKQLYLSQPDIQPDFDEQDYLIRRQLKPEARLDMIEYFKKFKLKPTAMIDISDGLSSELFHICQSSGVGAYLEESKIPVHTNTEQQALKFRIDPVTAALNGGEDYELLFTVAEEDLEKIRLMPDVFIIGEITKREDGITLHTSGGNIHPLKAQGWQHLDNQ